MRKGRRPSRAKLSLVHNCFSATMASEAAQSKPYWQTENGGIAPIKSECVLHFPRLHQLQLSSEAFSLSRRLEQVRSLAQDEERCCAQPYRQRRRRRGSRQGSARPASPPHLGCRRCPAADCQPGRCRLACTRASGCCADWRARCARSAGRRRCGDGGGRAGAEEGPVERRAEEGACSAEAAGAVGG